MTTSGGAEAGWYDDGTGTGQLRYYDGTAWTEHVHPPVEAAPVVEQAAQPAQAASAASVEPVVSADAEPVGQRPIGRKQGAWGLWWLCVITFGIYYLLWYQRINTELHRFANGWERDGMSQWWSQIIPIYGLFGLVRTADRLNQSHAAIGSPVRVTGGMSILSCLWFGSQTRYLQRRIDTLWDSAVAVRARQ